MTYDFIWIHRRIGIIIIEIKTKNYDQLPLQEQLKKIDNDLISKVIRLEELYQQFSGDNHCPCKLRSIICLSDADIQSMGNCGINYFSQIINQSLLNNQPLQHSESNSANEIFKKLSCSSFEASDSMLNFIAALFTYRHTTLFSTARDSLEIYQQRIEQQHEDYDATYLDSIRNEIIDIRDSGELLKFLLLFYIVLIFNSNAFYDAKFLFIY